MSETWDWMVYVCFLIKQWLDIEDDIGKGVFSKEELVAIVCIGEDCSKDVFTRDIVADDEEKMFDAKEWRMWFKTWNVVMVGEILELHDVIVVALICTIAKKYTR